jgi:hypothetical protein
MDMVDSTSFTPDFETSLPYFDGLTAYTAAVRADVLNWHRVHLF